jgi:hypothetical protein
MSGMIIYTVPDPDTHEAHSVEQTGSGCLPLSNPTSVACQPVEAYLNAKSITPKNSYQFAGQTHSSSNTELARLWKQPDQRLRNSSRGYFKPSESWFENDRLLDSLQLDRDVEIAEQVVRHSKDFDETIRGTKLT